jgi:4-amino-4-deoxy-L-arabinose transferase-like glycosyltransferase
LTVQEQSGSLRPLLLICALGVGLRAAFLLLASELEYQSDEANYVYLAMTWEHFGFYSDSYRYYWPPGYPFLLKTAIQVAGTSATEVFKWVQVVMSVSVGMTTMLFARRLFSDRAAKIAGLLWALYLPLIAYTHFLWSETIFLALFLPCCYLLLRACQEPERARDRQFVLAGLLMAGILYLKDAPLYLLPILTIVTIWMARPLGIQEGIRRGALFLMTTLVCILPWTLRNYEVYGRVVPIGSSLGENVYVGMNESYKNFDLTALDRSTLGVTPPSDLARPWTVRSVPGSNWRRAEEILNTADRLKENTARGLTYASEHPGWFVRTRLKKLADLVAPITFFNRHQGLGHYAESGSALGMGWLRDILVIWAFLCPIFLLLISLPAIALILPGGAARAVIGSVLLYFSATSLLVSMSRFRIPMVPFLIILAAGLLAGTTRRKTITAKIGAALSLLALGFLWWVNLPETLQFIRVTWDAVL